MRSSGYLERRRSAINFVNFVVQFPAAPSKQSISQTPDTRVSGQPCNVVVHSRILDIRIENESLVLSELQNY